jgi:hypothetical protein
LAAFEALAVTMKGALCASMKRPGPRCFTRRGVSREVDIKGFSWLLNTEPKQVILTYINVISNLIDAPV